MKKLFTLLLTLLLVACTFKADYSFQETTFEYSNDVLNTASLITVEGDVYVNADPQELNLNEVGKVTVKYTLKPSEASSKTIEFEQEFEIKDTKNPTITLKKDIDLELTEGDEFDLSKYLEKVEDEVDGELKYSEKEENNSYTTITDLDTEKEGEYEVTIVATDKNGNKSNEKFKIVVKRAQKAVTGSKQTTTKPVATKPSSSNNNNNNSNNNSNNSNNTPAPSNPTPQPTPQPSNPQPTQPSTPAHEHNWVCHDAEYKTVHHDAVIEKVWITDKEAYYTCEDDYEVEDVYRCPDCGMEDGWIDVHLHNCKATSDGSHGEPIKTGETRTAVLPNAICTKHEAEGHWEDKITKAAWDEQVLVKAGYCSCSCGATK